MYTTTGLDASNFVSSFNASFNLILWISLAFIAGLTIIMLYFVYRYNRKRHQKAVQIEGSTALEIIWTVIPILLALLMFYYGWAGWTPMSKPPKDAFNIVTTARMWSFSFQYENGRQNQNLVIPVNTPVSLKLISLDVNHSVYIPEFRIKSDIIPGREKVMWFRSDREGEYDLFCAEYCGLRHSYMNAKVQVLSKEKFDSWYKDTTMAPVDSTRIGGVSGKETAKGPAGAAATAGAAGAAGAEIMKVNGCNACHSTDGTKIVGPSFKGLFGSQQNVTRDGKDVTVTADEEYIKRSIYEPDADVVKGFQKGLMQSYKGKISDDDVSKLIEYLETLK
jgi:cytochrome c oxidase subunit 2